MYYMGVLAEISMQRDLDLELFGGEAAVGEGVFFVYELYGDDGVIRVERGSFTDSDYG